MRAFWAVLAGLSGSVVGFFALGLIGLLGAGDPGANTSGGAEMQAMMAAAPFGGVVGAIAGLYLALRNGGPGGKPGSPKAASQPLIAILIVGAVLLAVYFSQFHHSFAPQFSGDAGKPLVKFEIRVPAESIHEDEGFTAKAELRSGEQQVEPRFGLQQRSDGEFTVLSGEFEIPNRAAGRVIAFWPSYKIFVTFGLPAAADPEAETAYGQWRKAKAVELYESSFIEVYPLTPQEASIRTQIVWVD
ncbi:MAG: hypothetical protein AB3N20_05865 [Rhizobiaceae bacterium]